MEKEKIMRPDDAAFAANNKGVSLAIESHFAYAGDFGEPPKQIFAKMSRFVFAIIDKNDKKAKCVTANLRCDEAAAFFRKSDAAYGKCLEFAGKAAECAGDSPAYTVRFTTGKFKGMTAAQVLATGDRDGLNAHYQFLKENAAKYPGNKTQMEAILDAARLLEEGALNETEASSAAAGTTIVIHESGFRSLESKQKVNGKTFCYELGVTCNTSDRYPFEVRVRNYYAPIVEKEGGQRNIVLKEKEQEAVHSMRLSADQYYNMVFEMRAEMADYRRIKAVKVEKDAEKARRDNMESTKEEK